MIETAQWFKRKFSFDSPLRMFPGIVERLRGTPARLDECARLIEPPMLTRKPGESWSIQENIGHLLDLEPLWSGRIEDFLAGREQLRPADLGNLKTHDANHNQQPIAGILSEFQLARLAMVRRLDDFDEDMAGRTALHPRSGKPMRVIDLTILVVEHDDHHLLRMTRIKRQLAS